ncbi:MAG: PHB depolymerase family esterase [Bdellovibrionota bacterium]
MRRSISNVLVLTFLALALLPAAQAGTWSDHNLEIKSSDRDFRFYVPSALRQGEKRPLLVALHGCLQTPEDFAGLARLEKLADDQRIFLLLPKQGIFDNLNQCWNWFSASEQRRDEGEPGLIVGMVRWSKSKHAVDETRIYVAGISAGGGMTSILLATYPDVFAAGMMGSGTMYKAGEDLYSGYYATKYGSRADPVAIATETYESLKATIQLPRAIPLLVIHGSDDQSCAALNSAQTAQQFIALNDLADDGLANASVSSKALSIHETKIPKGYSYRVSAFGPNTSAVVVEHIVVKGMGHGWSGGDDTFRFNHPKGPDETALMWKFLSRYRK